MATIGQRIRECRIKAGLSVDELALRLGKNRATVYRYESDDIGNLPISIIPPLAKTLGVSPCYLMGWADEETPVTVEDDGLKEIESVFSNLSSDNRSKLLELSHLFLNAQHNSGEKK